MSPNVTTFLHFPKKTIPNICKNQWKSTYHLPTLVQRPPSISPVLYSCIPPLSDLRIWKIMNLAKIMNRLKFHDFPSLSHNINKNQWISTSHLTLPPLEHFENLKVNEFSQNKQCILILRLIVISPHLQHPNSCTTPSLTRSLSLFL